LGDFRQHLCDCSQTKPAERVLISLKISPAKNREIAICYGSNIGRNTVSCDVRSNEKPEFTCEKKPTSNESNEWWAAASNTTPQRLVQFDDEMNRQVMMFASSVAFITKLLPKNRKKIWICFADLPMVNIWTAQPA